jgi:hypothetical protein
MTAATITTADPGVKYDEENVVLTVTDGETYISKMSKPITCQLTWLETTTLTSASPAQSVTSTAISGRTITVAATGVTDKKAALCIKGYM